MFGKAKSKRQKAKVAYPSLLILALLLSSCGKPFNVKTRPDAPSGAFNARGESSGVEIEAQAVRDEDYLYDTFEANLIMAGVLPVRIRATNKGGEPIDLKNARFEIRSTRSYKSATASEAFKRVFSYYGITFYTKRGYEESRNDFVSHAIDLLAPLAAGESREGIVFFILPEDVARAAGLSLTVHRLTSDGKKPDAGLELKLN